MSFELVDGHSVYAGAPLLTLTRLHAKSMFCAERTFSSEITEPPAFVQCVAPLFSFCRPLDSRPPSGFRPSVGVALLFKFDLRYCRRIGEFHALYLHNSDSALHDE